MAITDLRKDLQVIQKEVTKVKEEFQKEVYKALKEISNEKDIAI